jgi:hypothetical protein
MGVLRESVCVCVCVCVLFGSLRLLAFDKEQRETRGSGDRPDPHHDSLLAKRKPIMKAKILIHPIGDATHLVPRIPKQERKPPLPFITHLPREKGRGGVGSLNLILFFFVASRQKCGCRAERSGWSRIRRSATTHTHTHPKSETLSFWVLHFRSMDR